jgi:hypothetical protein
VIPASNVFVRNEDQSLPAHRDLRFRIEVRGAEAIKELLQAVAGLIDWTRPLQGQPIPTLTEAEEREIRSGRNGDANTPFGLTQSQKAQVYGIRCSCGRVDFGPKLSVDGTVKWGYLWQFGAKCLCKRSNTT